MTLLKRSAAEICEIVKKAKEDGIYLSIPSTPAGIGYRAKEENWEYSEIPTKGGKGGLKKIYTLPKYVIDEFIEKGLLSESSESNKKKFSISEIEGLVSKLGLKSLPNTGRAIQYRAQNENWPFEESQSQGGKQGIKRIYPLPSYVIDELREKGLLEALEEADAAGYDAADLPQEAYVFDGFSDTYRIWAQAQETVGIVPVRYYKEVFASAGSGAIPWDTKPEAMWFRDSFFKYLGARPADCFCTRIDGDSMFPTLIDQGTALWYSTNQYTREGIYLFRQYDELRVKRMQRISTHIYRLISDNPNKSIYPTVDIDTSAHTQQEFEILGRYLWHCGIAK